MHYPQICTDYFLQLNIIFLLFLFPIPLKTWKEKSVLWLFEELKINFILSEEVSFDSVSPFERTVIFYIFLFAKAMAGEGMLRRLDIGGEATSIPFPLSPHLYLTLCLIP